MALSALTAGSRLNPPIDPQLWIDEAEEAVASLRKHTDDEGALAAIDWDLGSAYFYAAEIEHRRTEVQSALRYGDVATALLSPLAADRQQLPDASFLLGRLYFQIGAVHAVHLDNHREACRWYDRAADLLLAPYPVTSLASPSHHGDALVSMGVSYWQVGERERAYELTRAGAEIIGQAVSEQLLGPESIEVASDNLAAMGKALGKPDSLELFVPKTDAPAETQVAEKEPPSNSTNAPQRRRRVMSTASRSNNSRR